MQDFGVKYETNRFSFNNTATTSISVVCIIRVTNWFGCLPDVYRMFRTCTSN